jgi:hypothetical protein
MRVPLTAAALITGSKKMETNSVIEIFGKVAGIGGLALGVSLLIFRDVVAKNIFPSLTRLQAYQLLRMIIALTSVLGLSGIAAWTWSNVPREQPSSKWPMKFEDVRTAELVVSDVDDDLIISVNDRELQRVAFGQAPAPIPITPNLHRGSNKLSFVVLNGPFGGCGAKVSVHLNGTGNTEYSWHWFKDIKDACANCNCFTFNKTLYLQ